MVPDTLESPGEDVEEVMKAVLALILIYIGTFLVAIQGGSFAEGQAAPQGSSGAQSGELAVGALDPAKEPAIRSLLELVRARDRAVLSSPLPRPQFPQKLPHAVPNHTK